VDDGVTGLGGVGRADEFASGPQASQETELADLGAAPLEPVESHSHRFLLVERGAKAGGRWVHRPPATSSATAAGTTLGRLPTPPHAGSPHEGAALSG